MQSHAHFALSYSKNDYEYEITALSQYFESCKICQNNQNNQNFKNPRLLERLFLSTKVPSICSPRLTVGEREDQDF